MSFLSQNPSQRQVAVAVSFVVALLLLAGCAPTAVATNTLPPPSPTATTLPPSPTLAAPTLTPTPVASTPTQAASTPTAVSPSSTAVEVKLVEPPFKPPQSWIFEPMTVTVKVGTKITWTNTGAVLHTVDSDDNQTFKSGDLQPQATFTFTATTAGTFTYHCHYHPWMKGTLVVQP
jgi:plastocyanin